MSLIWQAFSYSAHPTETYKNTVLIQKKYRDDPIYFLRLLG